MAQIFLQKETPALGEEVDSDSSSRLNYASVRRDGFEYNIGDCCYLSPEAYGYSVKPAAAKKLKADKKLVRQNQIYLHCCPYASSTLLQVEFHGT